MIFLPASRLVAKPWKNGGGVTREVAAFPPDSGLDTFDWRVSIADVAADGPFSIFPGIDRTLTILSGEGIALVLENRTAQLHAGGDPYVFSGDQPAACTLLGGPVVDLNVMSRRSVIAHRVTTLSRPRRVAVEEGVLVWVAGIGRVIGAQGDFEMTRFDALEARSRDDWQIEGEDFLAYYAAFTRLR